MAFRDLAGPTWTERWAEHRGPARRLRWRVTSRWSVRPVGLDRCPPPSRRLRRAHMSRGAFLMLAVGWAASAAVLLIATLVIRHLG